LRRPSITKTASTPSKASAAIPARKRRTLSLPKRPSGVSAEPEVTPAVAPAPKRITKQAQVIALLSRPEGATLEAIIAATGWQAHTARAVLSGLRKAGYDISSDKLNGKRLYRIVNAAAASTNVDPVAALAVSSAGKASA
jgi:Protein of unknown function (DUF3489)